MSKFKVGERVIATVSSYTFDTLGKIGTVAESFTFDGCRIKFDGQTCAWLMKDSELKLVPTSHPTIIIHTDGTTTTALLKEGKKVVKQAKAVCAPTDIYDHEYGVRLALDRLFGHEVKVVPPETEWVPKVGDRVEVVESVDFSPIGSKGTICKFTNDGWSDIGVDMDEKTRDYLSCDSNCKKGYGNWFDKHQLKLISPAPKKPRIVKQERYEVGDRVKLVPYDSKLHGDCCTEMYGKVSKVIKVAHCERHGYDYWLTNNDGEVRWYHDEIEGKVISDD